MTDSHAHESTRSAGYQSARAEFERLRIEEKAQFLLEATFLTIGRGLEQAGQTISEELDGLFSRARQAANEPPRRPSATPGAAEGAAPDMTGAPMGGPDSTMDL